MQWFALEVPDRESVLVIEGVDEWEVIVSREGLDSYLMSSIAFYEGAIVLTLREGEEVLA